MLAVEEVQILPGLFASRCRGEEQVTAVALYLVALATRWQPMQNSIKPLGFEGKDRRRKSV